MTRTQDIEHKWVHVSYAEDIKVTETYGFVGSQGTVNLEGVLIRPVQGARDTVFLMMHPSSTLQLLPLPGAMAMAGHAVLCMGSRYAKSDTALIYEKVALDLNAAGLCPADGVVLEAAHRSRSRCLADWIDPSVLDENDPDQRDPRFDLYAPELPVRPPYPTDWLAAYRAAQRDRMGRITARVQETLVMLSQRGTAEIERGFITHRTMAEPRFLDGSIEPNDRGIGHCYLGVPETVNSGPVGLARFSMLRSWLSQWSLAHSRADGETCARDVTVPLLAIEHSAGDAVPQPDMRLMFDACASTDKQFHCIQGANHCFKGQPELLRQSVRLISGWAQHHGW